MKKFGIIFILLFVSLLTSGYKKPDIYVIDAVRNAQIHNNKGVNYVQDRMYYPAIQEFKIAISLNPDTQASAVFYNNLGEVYMKIGAPDLALDCFERAMLQYSLNLKYYQNLADCYVALKIADKKLQETNANSNPLNLVMRGIIYEKTGNVKRAITTLDEFTYLEPDLLITPAIKQHVQNLVRENL